jgi:PPOX class probable F420-dependent enzyme
VSVALDARATAFIEENQAAAMTTLRADGTPHSVRVGVAVMDGKVWSSGTQTRLRTKHLRRDPRSTLFVFPAKPDDYRWLALECTVAILDGPDAPELNLRLIRAFQSRLPAPPPEGQVQWFGRNLTIEEFLQQMVEEQRLIYEFTVNRAYGMY